MPSFVLPCSAVQALAGHQAQAEFNGLLLTGLLDQRRAYGTMRRLDQFSDLMWYEQEAIEEFRELTRCDPATFRDLVACIKETAAYVRGAGNYSARGVLHVLDARREATRAVDARRLVGERLASSTRAEGHP